MSSITEQTAELLALETRRREHGDFAVWDLPDFALVDGQIRARVCDDLVGCAAIVCLFSELERIAAEVTVEAGDGYVRLSWNDVPERAADPVTGEFDFEGYRVYRSTDPEFRDPRVVSTGTGSGPLGNGRPVAQFDLENGRRGFSDITVEGRAVSFRMYGVAGDPTFHGTLSEDGQTIAGIQLNGIAGTVGGQFPFVSFIEAKNFYIDLRRTNQHIFLQTFQLPIASKFDTAIVRFCSRRDNFHN